MNKIYISHILEEVSEGGMAQEELKKTENGGILDGGEIYQKLNSTQKIEKNKSMMNQAALNFKKVLIEKFENFKKIISEKFEKLSPDLKNKFETSTQPFLSLIDGLLNNFSTKKSEKSENEIVSKLSLTSQMTQNEIHYALTVTHTLIILILTPHHFLSVDNTNTKNALNYGHLQNQLAAYPSKIEQSLLLIA